MNKKLPAGDSLKFGEIASVIAVQFANRFIEKAKVIKLDDSIFASKPNATALHAMATWPDKNRDLTINSYDDYYVTPAAIVLVETISYNGDQLYKFFKPEMPKNAKAWRFLVTQDTAILVCLIHDPAGDYIRVDVSFQVGEN